MSTETITSFAQLALAAPVLKVIDEIGYEAPSPIQAESIPPLLAGRDLLGQAQTGTGKTAAFALPILSRIDLSLKQPQVLILAPTRELAIQVAEAMQTYARHLKGFHVLPVYGGQSIEVQLRQLKRGVHAVVGTPGRIQDHLRRKTLKLDALVTLVLDEADEMLRMGFIDDVEEILKHTPEQKQVALFSATMPAAIKKISKRYLHDPVEISIKTKTTTVSTITQHYWQVSGLHKLDALTRILEAIDFDAMLIFVRTKTATAELAEKLEARGFSSAPLNGDMNQAMREKTIDRLKRGTVDIVVATDVAARGLDVERISHVVNYDIPYDTEAYVHRIGRTGRAGRKGEAILFVSPREKRMLRMIETATRQTITPMQLPTHADIVDRRVTQFKQTITDTIEAEDLKYFEEMIQSYQQEHNLSLSEVAAALAFLQQRERPLRPVERKVTEKFAADTGKKSQRNDTRKRNERRPEKRPEKRADHKKMEAGMVRYRLEVGREHGVEPKHIVGAIANEAGLDSKHIGSIELHDNYSTVDLPEGMPKDICKHLKKVWVCGHQLRLSLFPLSKGTFKRNARPTPDPRKAGDSPPRKKPAGAASRSRKADDKPSGKKPTGAKKSKSRAKKRQEKP